MAHAHSSAPSGAPDHDQRPDRDALFWAAGAAILVLTAAAFWLSYEHLQEVARAHGLHGSNARAWAWPACLDLFIVVGETLMLRASLRRAGVDWWAVGLTLAGSGGSIALNIAGVGTAAGTLDYVVAGVPPTAALLAFGALMRQVHQALAGTAATSPVQPAAPAGTARPVPVPAGPRTEPTLCSADPLPGVAAFVWQPGSGTSGIAPELAVRALAVPAATIPASRGTAPVRRGEDAGTGALFREQVALARQWLAEDPNLTGIALGKRLGTGDSYGRRVRRAALAP